jgi:hypothetical protein
MNPGFRVTAEELSDENALRAMHDAAAALVVAALGARRDLLRLGFTDSHGLCRRLDRTAQEYADMQAAVREQAYTHIEPE